MTQEIVVGLMLLSAAVFFYMLWKGDIDGNPPRAYAIANYSVCLIYFSYMDTGGAWYEKYSTLTRSM